MYIIGGVVLTAVLPIWIRIQIRIQRIHVFLGLLDPDPDLDPSNIKQKFLLFCDFFLQNFA
jgi:hypothetical protein